MLGFQFCVLFMFMTMMMLMMTMVMLLKCDPIPRHHGMGFTSPFYSTVKPIPRSTWRLVRETNFTAPCNQVHGAVGLSCELKPYFRGAVESCPRPIEQIPRTYWINSIVPLNWWHRLHRPVKLIVLRYGFSHIISLWSVSKNHNKVYVNKQRMLFLKTMSEQTIFLNSIHGQRQMGESFFHISVNSAIHALIEPEHIG